MKSTYKESALAIVTLVATSGALFFCTLPILLVSLGVGATVATVATKVHLMLFLGEYKFWIFLTTGALLLLSDVLTRRKSIEYPNDPEAEKISRKLTKLNQILFWISACIWSVSFFAAYLMVPITVWLE